LSDDCCTEDRKSSAVKRTTRHGRGSPVKDGGQRDKPSGRKKSARFRADVLPQLKVTTGAEVVAVVMTMNSDDGS